MRSAEFGIACVLFLGAASISGCMETMVSVGPTTSFQSEGDTGGYTETDLGDGKYKISTMVNGISSQESAKQMSLYRAAQVTSERNYPYFELLEEISTIKCRGLVPISKGGSADSGWPIEEVTVRFLMENKSDKGAKVFDAKKVMSDLRMSIDRDFTGDEKVQNFRANLDRCSKLPYRGVS